MSDSQIAGEPKANPAVGSVWDEGHQQVADQCEQQSHSERNFNGLRTICKPAPQHFVLPKSAIRHRQAAAGAQFLEPP
jgi:hypothetical protein